jgi:hypothetical protein
MSDNDWKKHAATVVIGLVVAGLVAIVRPFAVAALRAWRRAETERARHSPQKADDDFWRVWGPAVDAAADGLERGDPDRARQLAEDLRRSFGAGPK